MMVNWTYKYNLSVSRFLYIKSIGSGCNKSRGKLRCVERDGKRHNIGDFHGGGESAGLFLASRRHGWG